MSKIIQKNELLSSFTNEQAVAMTAISLLRNSDIKWESGPFGEKYTEIEGHEYRVRTDGQVIVQHASKPIVEE